MKKRLAGYAIALIFAATSLSAALEFTLVPAVQSAAVGTEITFSGTLTNNSQTDTLFLNDIQFSFDSGAAAALTADSNVFFANVPGILLPNETYSGPIFTIALNSSADPADYTGSVTILGGADIFAATDLVSQNLQVSSPLITISANTPDAYELGPVSGAFTVSRTGATNYDLVVNYTVTGSASPGTRYNTLSGFVTLTAGNASSPITVSPIPNDVADGTQTVTLTISPLATYNVGIAANDTVNIHDKPMDEWRLQYFGGNANVAAIAGDAADPDQDGVNNLLEYAFFSDPNVSNVVSLPAPIINGNHLQLQFHRNTSAADVTYVVEGRSDLIGNDWAPVITRTPGNDWVANEAGAAANESGSGDFVSVTITDSVPIIDPNTSQPTPKRFLRLRVQH